MLDKRTIHIPGGLKQDAESSPCYSKWYVMNYFCNFPFMDNWNWGKWNCIEGGTTISSVAQSCPTLCDSMNRSTPGLPVHHQLPEFTQTHVHRSQWCHPAISSSVIPSSSCLQSFPASGSFPVSGLFWVRWPNYWSFSFNISPSSEYWVLISFRIDWFDLLAVQGTLKSLFQHHS